MKKKRLLGGVTGRFLDQEEGIHYTVTIELLLEEFK